MSPPELTLYHRSWCGYCHTVRAAARRLSVPLSLVDLDADNEATRSIQERRGRQTVPVLGIPTSSGEQLLGESSQIVEYLRSHAARYAVA